MKNLKLILGTLIIALVCSMGIYANPTNPDGEKTTEENSAVEVILDENGQMFLMVAGSPLPQPLNVNMTYEYSTDAQVATHEGNNSFAVQSGVGDLTSVAVESDVHTVPSGGGSSSNLFIGSGNIPLHGGGYIRYEVMIIANYIVVWAELVPCC